MAHPNTLVFIDIPVDDVDAANTFYSEVFNWVVEERIPGVFHRIVPGGNYKNEDGSPSEIGNLHMGLSNAANVRPHPDGSPQEPTFLKGEGRAIRAWILISEDDSFERIIDAARERLDLPEDAFFVNIDRFGNTSAASVPVALDEALRAGRVQKGKLAIFVAFGAGLTWGGSLVRW